MNARLLLLILFLCGPYASAGSDDLFHERVFAETFAERRAEFVRHVLSRPANRTFKELIRVDAGLQPDEAVILRDLEDINARLDCADFDMHAMLRLLFQFGDRKEWSPELLGRVKDSILGFKYWPDEPGIDSMCTWSENHHILFSAAGYLAGQLFPDAVFTNSGRTGHAQMGAHRPRVLRWLDFRFRTGFSEWLSNVYYDEDLTALLSLADFCEDKEIATRAAMVLDLMCADLALHNFRGVFGSTHGRTYEQERKHAHAENTSAAQVLLLGRGIVSGGGISAPSLALSVRYRMPRVIYDMANDLEGRETEIRQRMGIRIEDAAHWGLGFDSVEDGMVWLSLEAYAHPRTINLMVDMLDRFHWWRNEYFNDFREFRGLLRRGRQWHVLPALASLLQHDLCRNTREEVNIYTYRTPAYMLSTAQDYRRGYGGDQQHIWQATLGPEAVCFTSHPSGRRNLTPSYWSGYGTLPRAAQIKNVVLEVYNLSVMPGLYVTNRFMYTHAWFPRDAFDEFVERGHWLFGRRGRGYLALWSQNPYEWQQAHGDDAGREVIVHGRTNIYLCEMGDEDRYGDFNSFIESIAQASISTDKLGVVYESPSQGRLEFGWFGPLKQNGAPVALSDYPRYETPYGTAAFPSEQVSFEYAGQTLKLDWRTATRQVSAFIE